ncbi:MAG TPA: ABC transporter permease [Vicinamibacteria bacterium]|nr:ABC transporter permease [Vicinamibacteria bacterium]
MAWREAWWKLAALLRRRRLERDLDEELRFHLERRAQAFAADGLGDDDARLAAERRFGNALALKEACRDAWTFPRAEAFVQDARIALRALRKAPVFASVTVLSLAIGIGANVAMFSLVSGVLLRPLPYPEADRLVRLTGFYPRGALVAMQQRSRAMDVAGAVPVAANLTGQGEAERLTVGVVSANLFAVLGRGPSLGRGFQAGDDVPGRDRLVVLGHSLWVDRFRSDPAVVGRTIALDGVERQVVGVMPAGFHFPTASTRAWIPLRLDPASEGYWGFGWMPLVARLRPGVDRAQAHEELRRLVDEVAKLFPWPAPTWNPAAAAIPLQDDVVRDIRPKLLVLQAAVGMVLLIACANVASLLLARATARRREMALRASLGAGRGRILRQLLTESAVLGLLGGTAGLLLAWLSLAGVRAALLDPSFDGTPVVIDGMALAFVAALALLCGLLFGLVPALAASRVDLIESIKSGSARSASRGGVRARAAFIAAEVALAVVLAIGAGLLVRTLWGLTQAEPGFRAEQTLAVGAYPGESACEPRQRCVALYDGLRRRARESEGVTAAALASAVPMDGDQPLLPVELEGHPLSPVDATATLLWAGAVSPEYFDLLHIPLLRGRLFGASDVESSEPVVIVSAGTARRFWPGQDPIGRTVRVAWEPRWRTVVGIVGDVRQYALSGWTPQNIEGAVYMPYPQSVALDRRIPWAMTLLVRTSGSAPDLPSRLRGIVAGVSPDVPASEVRALSSLMETSVSEPRSLMWTFAAFAACALLLAALGTYGIVSYQLSQRTYEIGVRLAIGASRGHIFGLVVGQSLRLVAGGLAVGLLGAALLGRYLSSFLYGISAHDPLTFAGVAALLLATALLAAAGPGRRAARTDAVRALRAD